jgi:hypothetical protein
MSNEAEEAFVKDINPLVITQYLQIATLWCSRKLNPKLRPPSWVTAKYLGIHDYTSFELFDLLSWCLEAFIQGVEENERRT